MYVDKPKHLAVDTKLASRQIKSVSGRNVWRMDAAKSDFTNLQLPRLFKERRANETMEAIFSAYFSFVQLHTQHF